MGLSHSWERPTELPAAHFASAVRDVQLVVESLAVPLGGFDGTGSPIFLPDTIVFNGRGGDAVEPFEVHQTEFDRRGRPDVFAFCKTLGAPYDACVRVALIVLQHHLGDQFRVGSDANDERWGAARDACERLLGYGRGFSLAK